MKRGYSSYYLLALGVENDRTSLKEEEVTIRVYLKIDPIELLVLPLSVHQATK